MWTKTRHRAPNPAIVAAFSMALASAALAQSNSAKPVSILPGSAPSAATAAPAKPAGGPEPAKNDRQEIVNKVNAYLNGIVTLTGEFDQIGSDGRKFSGKLFLHKPGKLRFQYDAPSNVEVIADGSNVAIRDRRLNTQELVSIKQTPLKFLVNRTIDIERDVKFVSHKTSADSVSVVIEDKATFGGGTSRINLVFDPKTFTLRQWIVRDPQGQETNVRLANLSTEKKPDPKLFVINYERMLDTSGSR
jgi:outer membrane lipoprotein-sorting protein